MRLFDLIHRRRQHDPSLVNDRHPIGDSLDLVEEMRREEDRPPFVGDRADDRPQDVAADDRIQSRRGLVKDEQIGAVRESHQQSRPRPLAARQRFHAGIGVEVECLPQLFGEFLVPVGEEGLRVAHQLADPHPVGKVAVFREIPDPSQRADRVLHGIETEDFDRTRLRLEHSEDVLDEGRLAGAVAADQPEDAAARHRERHVVKGRLAAKLPREPADLDNGRCRGRKGIRHVLFLEVTIRRLPVMHSRPVGRKKKRPHAKAQRRKDAKGSVQVQRPLGGRLLGKIIDLITLRLCAFA